MLERKEQKENTCLQGKYLKEGLKGVYYVQRVP